MDGSVLANGRELTPAVLARIAREVETRPELSRTQLARDVCAWLGWEGHDGEPKVTSCRIALRQLERRGLIALPEAKGGFSRAAPSGPGAPPASPITCSLDELGELSFVAVTSAQQDLHAQWNDLMAHHYLGLGPLVGRQVRYLVGSDHGWVGALAFSAAAWAVAARDQWIGWSRRAREANLQYVVANSRFLVPPWVDVPNLASKLLAVSTRQLPQDWQERYGYQPVLVETYVEHARFAGTCYRAATWQHVGQTCGRGRQDRTEQRDQPIKDIYLCALQPDWRATLRREPGPRPPRLAAPADWAEEEFGGAARGAARRRPRLLELARTFYARPMCSIPQACEGEPAPVKAAYRWLANEHVNLTDVLQPHYEATARRVAAHAVVLAVQDTTFFNYSGHAALDAGPIGTPADNSTGIVMHDTMAFTAQGLPLGLLDVQAWARDRAAVGKKHQRHTRPIERKESAKWLRSYQAAAAVQELCPDTTVISVGDREADVYELFAEARSRDNTPELLIRAEQNRRVNAEQPHLWAHVEHQPLCGTVVRPVARTKTSQERHATLELRYAAVELQPPRDRPRLGPTHLWAVQAKEVDAAADVQPLEWMLLTTMEVATADGACRMLDWYATRWGIETFHKVLKSGCRIEERQLATVRRIENCLAIDLVVAWRVQQLTMLGRETPELPCTVFFEDHQWKALYAFVARDPTAVPAEPPPIREAMRVAARLGGFLGRKSDGEPGVKALWIGLQRLDDIAMAWLAFRPQPALPDPDTS
ncbi:MAG: IS4 family transposase [Alphaproteobacteria bacterium]